MTERNGGEPGLRFPFAPLEQIARGRYPTWGADHQPDAWTDMALARVLGIGRRQIYRWRATGLAHYQADRVAANLGHHPANIWPDLWDRHLGLSKDAA